MLLGGAGGGGWYLYGQARGTQARIAAELDTAQTDIENAKSLLGEATAQRDASFLDRARAAADQARVHFRAARAIADHDPLLSRALSVPGAAGYLRPRIKAVDGLADMGLAIADTVSDGADLDARLVKTDDVPGSGGAKLMQVLKESAPQIDRLVADLQRAKQAVGSVDEGVLTSSQRTTVDKARDTIAKGLAGVQALKTLTPVLFEIMGVNGPRTYLVEQVNPAELRAGGGFIGSYSVIQADGGTIKKVKSGGIEEVDYPRPTKGQRGYVAPPATMTEFIGDLSWVLGDSNYFPDFPTNAKWGEYFADKEIHVKPDGVIALDPTAVAYLLEVTGPIPIPGYNITVQSKDFEQFLFAYENGPGRIPGRKSLLGVVADALLDKVSNLPATAWPKLVSALNKAGQERHFQVAFDNPAAEAMMSDYHWANDLNPAKSHDFLMAVESNFGATKANHFVTRSFAVALTRSGNVVHHHVVVSILEDLNAPVVPNQDNYYRCYARLYFPSDATNLSVKDLKADRYPNQDLPPGTQMLDGWLQINPDAKTKNGSWTITYDYDVPYAPEQAGSETLYWQKQPGTLADGLSVSYEANGRSVTATAKLVTDVTVRYGDSGIEITPADTKSAALPSISF